MGGDEGGMIWENSIETCILSYVKQIASPGSMHETGCSGLVCWDDPEGWDEEGRGGGFRMGNTCTPMADSHQLLLSCFSRVQLCVTPWTAAYQASPSMGFSRQEHWSGLPFPSPMHESGKWKWSRSVMSNSSDPMDFSLLGFSVHGIFQARVLEWVAIAFSDSSY